MTDTPTPPPDSDPSAPATTSRRRRWIFVGLAVVVVLAVAAGAFLWWFFRDDAPDEVNIADAAAQVAGSAAPDPVATDASAATDAPVDDGAATADTTTPETTPADGAASSPISATDPEPAADGLDGTWTVDTSIGEFSFEDSTGTFVGFRVAEELAGLGSTTAVGRTPAVTGSLDIEGTTVTGVTVEADMTQITTNDGRRDDNVQRALDTGDFPTATFVLTEPIELGETAVDGRTVSAEGSGDLTIHGVTRAVTIPLDAQLVDDTIVVVGSLDITFSDYGVEVPSAPIVLSASDEGPIELQLFFTR